MNLSGGHVAAFCKAHGIAAPDVMVLCDDLALPFAKVRFRKSGSSGGHNGLRSIEVPPFSRAAPSGQPS